MYVPRVDAIQLAPSAIKEAALPSAQEIIRTLPVGAVIQVTVGRDRSGNRGVQFRGRFSRAALPGNVEDGSKLAVEVGAHDDVVVLKILPRSGVSPAPRLANPTPSPLMGLLQGWLDEDELTALRNELATPPGLAQIDEQLVSSELGLLRRHQLMLANPESSEASEIEKVIKYHLELNRGLNQESAELIRRFIEKRRLKDGAKPEADLLDQLIAILKAQRGMHSVSTALSALGEPRMTIIPAVSSGTLGRCLVETFGEERPKDGPQSEQQYRRAAFSVCLPALGEVAVDLAWRGSELLAQLVTGNDAALDIFERRRSELLALLERLGFNDAMLMVRLGDTRRLPPWFQELVRIETSA